MINTFSLPKVAQPSCGQPPLGFSPVGLSSNTYATTLDKARSKNIKQAERSVSEELRPKITSAFWALSHDGFNDLVGRGCVSLRGSMAGSLTLVAADPEVLDELFSFRSSVEAVLIDSP